MKTKKILVPGVMISIAMLSSGCQKEDPMFTSYVCTDDPSMKIVLMEDTIVFQNMDYLEMEEILASLEIWNHNLEARAEGLEGLTDEEADSIRESVAAEADYSRYENIECSVLYDDVTEAVTPDGKTEKNRWFYALDEEGEKIPALYGEYYLDTQTISFGSHIYEIEDKK